MKDSKYLERIIVYANKIRKYMLDVVSYEDFANHSEKIDAVILNLEQIGETVGKLSEKLKEQHSSIPWRKIRGLRNMISHEYEGVDPRIIYDIVTIDIPDLLMKLTLIKE